MKIKIFIYKLCLIRKYCNLKVNIGTMKITKIDFSYYRINNKVKMNLIVYDIFFKMSQGLNQIV